MVEKVSDIHIDVFRNDKIKLEQVAQYDKIILSPGPGLPSQAGMMPEILRQYKTTKPIFGVCLGLQAIGEAFGCPLKNLLTVFHGIATPVNIIAEDEIFNGCPTTFNAGRYHSWVIDEKKIAPDLLVTATDQKHLVMAARHIKYDIRGVQFHPESILSEYGETIIRNWINIPQKDAAN